MKIIFSINYKAEWGQGLYICGTIPELGNNNEIYALPMSCVDGSQWISEINLPNDSSFNYYYLVKKNGNFVRRELGKRSQIRLLNNHSYSLNDVWLDRLSSEHLYTSGFTDCFYRHEVTKMNFHTDTILLKVRCPYVKQGQSLRLCGETDYFGNWDPQKALNLSYLGVGEWFISLDTTLISTDMAYKLLIYDDVNNAVIHWDEGSNRVLRKDSIWTNSNNIRIDTLIYIHSDIYWYAAGVSIPVFSLRTKESCGIGEFSDLRKLVDWASHTGQKIIQILPINDTTVAHNWTDSYPYSAISIYALHPIYLGIHDFPLGDQDLMNYYRNWADTLNEKESVDYEEALKLKEAYLADLYKENGALILESKEYKDFFDQNEDWLFSYACFCYFRDKYKTADYRLWTQYKKYNKDLLKQLYDASEEFSCNIKRTFFIQFLLDKQLKNVREYAHSHSVILKGDIPIGINRNSVDAWVDPHLFNLDMQAGAPPDAFSDEGQNWGFPTYNWDEMAKDKYIWWIKRFRKMSDYFDAYRIDHILGFFRIWEIPDDSLQGLLGYFNPALPYSVEELQDFGLSFDDDRMTKPYITKKSLYKHFDEHIQEVVDTYLYKSGDQCYSLNLANNTQRKIQDIFKNKNDEKSLKIKRGLYSLCNEVLFVRDKYHLHDVHPRISAQNTDSYKNLSVENKIAFDRLYNEFFFHRHNQFWFDNAMIKLPILISATNMLVCGEDLGMIPACVPIAMQDLQILSLEIERMPKVSNYQFADLRNLPYLSVCTTSTHDMSPLRLWWQEDYSVTQKYYQDILYRQGDSPSICSSDISRQILTNHLNSSSMLVILPIQDWLAMSDKYKRPDPKQERINVPSITNYYWRYRMHMTIENLIEAKDLNDEISELLLVTNRRDN